MEIRYNKTGPERKALVAAVSEITKEKAVYLGAPSFSFAVDVITIDRYGTLTFGGDTSADEVRGLVAGLEGMGFVAAEVIGIEEGGAAEQAVPDGIAIEFPLEGFTELSLSNLEKLIASKAALIRKALGADALPIERLEDRLRFPWLPVDAAPELIDACTRLVAALCDTAKFQRRVTAQEKPVENERYAMRCFLLRLGFIGDEYASARKTLLENMTGDGSFKGGKRGNREIAVVPADEVAVNSVVDDTDDADRLVRGGLCRVPPTDCNYASYLRDATDGQLRKALAIMEAAPDGNKGRIAACGRELKKRGA